MIDVFIAMYLGFASIGALMLSDAMKTDGIEFVNPIWIYKRFKVNWFGAIVITIVFHILTLPFAIGYWFYKLCTVGRKD